MLAFASAASISGQFSLSVPNGTRWDHVERGISEYLLSREVSAVEPGELSPMAETVETDVDSPESMVAPTIETEGALTTEIDYHGDERISVPMRLGSDVADSSLDPAEMTDEERAAIISGDCLERQVQGVVVPVRYWIHRNRTLKFVWIDRARLLRLWRINDARSEERRAAIRLLLSMIRECRLSRGERVIPAAKGRMADSEPAAFIAPPRHATPIRSAVVADSSGVACPRFDAVFAAELPIVPQTNRHPVRRMTEMEVETALESLEALRQATAARQKQVEPLRYVTHRPQYWIDRMFADCLDY